MAMIEAFDGSAEPLAGLWPAAAALVLLTACLAWRLSGRRLLWIIPLGIAVIGIFGGLVPSWDQIRIRKMLASGEGLQTTRGTIDQTWHLENRTRDTTSSMKNSYKTVVSEGFDMGADRFSWVVGNCLSPASLCELARSKAKLERGIEVEVTWFADPAQQDERRIVRLRVRS
ncbi:hypothetical protein KRR38_15795 [Novosphingobium sp. G106]|uniref:hypothetical protein n=1 Tax=Novosphingobium sp. G106 TaxID=2849500 RepID=UPI001C2CE4BB|nr:hypothetical protein [Novosphingobium sp. G106]MBV1689096.1 hypothetical protein [Novosphingobium sp. G106]